MVGNFIDFGAMDSVDVNELKRLIKNAKDQPIDEVEYKNFIGELKNAKKVAYIIDNAGEIVFDKVFIDVIKKTYPEIDIDVIVRGKPIYNDATILDAEDVGMYKIANVIENGTNIPGTQLDKINEKSRHAILSADLIISKGQGNFEGLYGCGKNIYYIFLCKCDLFVKRFNMKKFTGIFANEKNIRNMIAK
jgi:damage-control phosphatase, subfamily I